ncbi:MAG: hypothetical protein WAT70_03165, partial [Rhizobiaceae bacterium]
MANKKDGSKPASIEVDLESALARDLADVSFAEPLDDIEDKINRATDDLVRAAAPARPAKASKGATK